MDVSISLTVAPAMFHGFAALVWGGVTAIGGAWWVGRRAGYSHPTKPNRE